MVEERRETNTVYNNNIFSDEREREAESEDGRKMSREIGRHAQGERSCRQRLLSAPHWAGRMRRRHTMAPWLSRLSAGLLSARTVIVCPWQRYRPGEFVARPVPGPSPRYHIAHDRYFARLFISPSPRYLLYFHADYLLVPAIRHAKSSHTRYISGFPGSARYPRHDALSRPRRFVGPCFVSS